MVGLFFIVITLIICGTILFALYMNYCDNNRVGMFSHPRYEERIANLEKIVTELYKLCESKEK